MCLRLACLAALLAAARASVIVYTQDLPHSIAEEFRDMPASFGPELPLEGLRGLLANGAPADGCAPLAPPPAVADNFTGKWVVLVARYNCSFEVKVRNAQMAGYDCVIVHNVNSSDLETMSAKDAQGILIPSVFVSDVAGLILAENYNYTSGYYIMVNGDLPFNINTHLLLPFAIVVVLCLLVILIFMIVKCIKDRRRARRHRLPNRCLKKIPTCKFSKGDPYDTCAICLDDYLEGERLRVLPCAHAYHAACIDPWLTQNRRVCPVCKRKVLAAGERRPARAHQDSDSDDTEPLLNDVTANTDGGTFVEQSENPFRRAARLARERLRRVTRRNSRDTDNAGNEEAPPPAEANSSDSDDDDSRDTRPLVAQVSAASERPRSDRPRRARSAPRRPSGPAPAPLLHSADHSINTDTQPEEPYIGVAALPATQASSAPHRVDL